MSPLLIMLFAAMGPMLAVFDPFEDDTADEEDQADLNPRNQIDPEAQTGTEEDDAFAALADQASTFNGLSGADQIIGSGQGDTLIGGLGSDTISGGAGNDNMFSGLNQTDDADDEDPDLLEGGEGDDNLLLGAGDTGLGGAGADTFTIMTDHLGTVTVGDYNSDEDALIVETTGMQTSIADQVVQDGTLQVTLSNGLRIDLPGVDNPLNDNAIRFVMPNPLRGIS